MNSRIIKLSPFFALFYVLNGSAQSSGNAWEGAYGELAIGYGVYSPSYSNGTAQIPTGAPRVPYITGNVNTSTTNSIKSLVGQVALGYNYAIDDNYLIGLGASYNPFATGSDTATMSTSYRGTVLSTASESYHVKNVYNIYLSPAYALDNDKLAYAKIGYSGATMGISSPTVSYTTVNLTGYTLGLGYKQMITNSIYLLGEVNYASYGNQTATATTSRGVNISHPVSLSATNFLVGAGYRF